MASSPLPEAAARHTPAGVSLARERPRRSAEATATPSTALILVSDPPVQTPAPKKRKAPSKASSPARPKKAGKNRAPAAAAAVADSGSEAGEAALKPGAGVPPPAAPAPQQKKRRSPAGSAKTTGKKAKVTIAAAGTKSDPVVTGETDADDEEPTPLRPLPSGPLGQAVKEDMVNLLEAAGLQYLKAPLNKAGLLGVIEFGSYNKSGLTQIPTGLVYKETRVKLCARLLKTGKVPDAQKGQLADDLDVLGIFIKSAREASVKARLAAAAPELPVTALADVPPGAAPGGPFGPRLTIEETRRAAASEAHSLVTAQNRRPPPVAEIPNPADIAVAQDGFRQRPPYPAPLVSTTLKSAGQVHSSATSRTSKAPKVKHQRGKTTEAECRLLEKWSLVHAYAGTMAVPEHYELTSHDDNSGIITDAPPVQPTGIGDDSDSDVSVKEIPSEAAPRELAIVCQYHVAGMLSGQVRREAHSAKLSGSETRKLVDEIMHAIRYTMMTHHRTFTTAVLELDLRRLAEQCGQMGRSDDSDSSGSGSDGAPRPIAR